MDTIRGRARKFGANIDTDIITPAPILSLPIDEIKKHAFGPISSEFYKTVKSGDIIVAGDNFGCGSSREQATAVIRELGIRVIVCESMARIYFRNCIALGVYPVKAKGVSRIVDEGDEIEINLRDGVVKNVKTGKTAAFKPLIGTLKDILEKGGILPFLKMRTEACLEISKENP